MKLNIKYKLTKSSDWPKNFCGIYGIVCQENKRVYVGRTNHKSGFNGRWNDHRELLRANKHDNPYLQHAYNKYGEDSFYIKVLEICEKGDKIIEKREWEWIEKLESMYFQKGFNIDSHERYESRKCSYRPSLNDRCVEFELIDPNGELIKGKNLKKFALENDLDPGNLNRVFNGKQSSYKGYKSSNPNFHKKEIVHKIISPLGEEFEFKSMERFAKEHNLCESNLSELIKGTFLQLKGWYLPNILENEDCSHLHPARIKEIVNFETGTIHKFKNIKFFCEKYNLPREKVTLMLRRELFKDLIRYRDWCSVLAPLKAIKQNGQVYRFFWTTQINKKLGIPPHSLLQIINNNNKKNKYNIEVVSPFPMKIIEESF